MSLMKRITKFFKRLFGIDEKATENEIEPLLLEGITEEDLKTEAFKDDKISLAQRTLMTKLYALEQDISFFETEFPKEYEEYMEKINKLKEEYNSSLNNMNQELTFEIDPDSDMSKLSKVLKLEKEIKFFLETQVKFDIICKRLQKLIIKLNILYNTSIYHCNEKAKIMSQIERAIKVETDIAREFKSCYYITNNKQFKERIINLLSFIDYEILKTCIRNSDKLPETLVEKLVTMVEFNDFDYVKAFENFIKDELTDLCELLPLINDEQYRKIMEKKLKKILTDFIYSSDVQSQILDFEFWNDFFEIESSLIELLKSSGIEKEKAKVRILDRMDISVKEDEVLVLPKTNAYLSLTNLYTRTHDEKVFLLMKLLKTISNDVTYKEIYFLAILVDSIDTIMYQPNDLLKYLEKYIDKYPYNKSTIDSKKQQLLNSSKKDYVVVFTVNEYEENIINTLKELNIDFMIVNDNVLINSFYFNGLENVLNTFKNNTNAITNNTNGGNNNG